MTKILMLLTEPPFNPINGITNKTYNLLEAIKWDYDLDIIIITEHFLEHHQRGNSVFTRKIKIENHPGPPIFRKTLSAIKGYPYEVFSRFVKPFRSYIKNLANNHYDIVHIDLINLILFAGFFSPEKVILSLNDPPDIISQARYRSAPYGLEKVMQFINHAYGRKFYHRFINKFKHAHFVSERDLKYVDHYRFSTISIPVGIETIKPPANYRRIESNRISLLIMGDFTISWIYEPVKRILDSLASNSKAEMEVHITLLGKGTELLSTQSTKTINIIRELWIDDIHDSYLSHDAVIVPDCGGFGIKNRLIQSLYYGNICIIQEQAMNGLPLYTNRHCYSYQSEYEVLSIVEMLSKNNSIQQEMRKNAIHYIDNKHSLNSIRIAWKRQYKIMEENNAETRTKSKIW